MNHLQIDALAILADPEQMSGIAGALDHFTAAELIEVAEQHNISAIIFQKILQLKTGIPEPLKDIVDAARDQLRITAGVMMDLDFHGRVLSEAFVEHGIPYRLVKGNVFAQSLYEDANLRPYTDVDIVVANDQFEHAIKIAEAFGLSHQKKDILDHTEANQEAKLTKPGSPHLLIEIHSNLVHMRALRRRKKIGLVEIEQAYDWQTPFVGHFVVAVAHASLGHKFHNLKLLVDCLQAMRKLRETDLPHLDAVVHALNIEVETATCLGLCASVFASEKTSTKASTISRQLSLPSHSRLVRGVDVMQAPFKRSLQSRWRRRLFRLYQLS